MLSTQVLPKVEWIPFKEVLGKATKDKGVYFIRMKGGVTFHRLRGDSDIVYIGKATNQNGFKGRFVGYIHPGPTQHTNQKINAFDKKYELEVGFFPNPRVGKGDIIRSSEILESNYLEGYESEHDELPPLNNATIRKFLLKPTRKKR